MVTQYRTIFVLAAAWRMGKSDRDTVVPGDWLKTNWVLAVVLPNCCAQPVVKSLQVDPLGHGWNHYRWILPRTACKRLIN